MTHTFTPAIPQLVTDTGASEFQANRNSVLGLHFQKMKQTTEMLTSSSIFSSSHTL